MWAEHVANNTARENDDVFDEVKKHFNDAELVELTGACGWFASANRLQDSLHLPIEVQAEVDKIKKEIRIDPGRVKAYIENLLESWPEECPVPHNGASDEAGKRTVTDMAAASLSSRTVHQTDIVARVPLLDSKTAQGEKANFFVAAEQLLGGLTNAIRVWGHSPYLAKLFLPFQVALERVGTGGVLPSTIKLMVLIRTSYMNAAPYSLAHRTVLARYADITENQLVAIGSGDSANSPHFSPRERVAILWAEHVASNTAKRHNDVFDELKRYFDDAEIVELTGLCALGNMVDRIQNALRVPVETDIEIEAINQSVRMDPKRIKTYLEALIRKWPQEFPVPSS